MSASSEDRQPAACVCVCVCVWEAIQNVMTALAGPSVVRPSHLHPLSADEYVTLQTPALIVVQRANAATDLRSGLLFFHVIARSEFRLGMAMEEK